MKRFVCALLAAMMMLTCAFADCGCLTDDVRVAMFDLLSVDGLTISEEDRDTIIQGYLGMDPECIDLKQSLLAVLISNNTLVESKLTAEKYLTLTTYLTSCFCDCAGEGEQEEDEPTTTNTPAPTTKPNKTRKPAATATPKPHTHHFTKVYYANATYHRWKCSCGESKLEKHDWTVSSKSKTTITYKCTVCGGTKTEDIPASEQDNGCPCDCSGKTCSCCNCNKCDCCK